MWQDPSSLNLVVCGGGHGAHILSGSLSSRFKNVSVYASYGDEAKNWNSALGDDEIEVAKPIETQTNGSLFSFSFLLFFPPVARVS
jgi:hypothetical protein